MKLNLERYLRGGSSINDTSREVSVRFRKMIIKKSGQERLKMGFSMSDLARDQVIASIREKDLVDDRKMREEMFSHFYRQGFPPDVRDRIVTYLKDYGRQNPRNHRITQKGELRE